jgi:drug/metabolite transporter (DMT)-like permease
MAESDTNWQREKPPQSPAEHSTGSLRVRIRLWLAGSAGTAAAFTFTVICWSSAFAGIRAGLQDYSPAHVALLRFLTASTVLLVIAVATRMPLPSLRDLPGIAFAGLLGIAVYNLALTYGEQYTAAGVASLIVASAPIVTALLAIVFLGERLRVWGWVGMATCFIGVAVIALTSGGGLAFESKALVLLVAPIAQGIFFASQKPYLRRYSAFQFTAYAIWTGTLALLPFAGGLVETMQSASAEATLAIVYMGIFPGALAFVTWAYGLARTPASTAASFLYLVPAAAIAIGWAWLGEVPGLPALLGGVLVLAGVIIVNRLGKARDTRKLSTDR